MKPIKLCAALVASALTISAVSTKSDSFRKIDAVQCPTLMQTIEAVTTTEVTTTAVTTVTTAATTTEIPIPEISASDMEVHAVSVSCLEVKWTAEQDREYEVSVTTDAPFQENIQFVFKGNDVCYLTGLRESSAYTVSVSPILHEGERGTVKPCEMTAQTDSVEVIEDFPREEGWTGCFAGERASGLTAMPSSGAIADSFCDTITGTGIRRKENGDYCCAMGLFYGTVGDRFLVELDNGIQFTVQICDSKGWADDADGDGVPDGRFHRFGGDGKCVIEFIYQDGCVPSAVWTYGSWGVQNWNGLNLCSDIASIRKIASN